MDADLMVTNVATTFAKQVQKQSGQVLLRLGSNWSNVGLRREETTGTRVAKAKAATREAMAIDRVLPLQMVARKFAAITLLAMDIVDLVIIAGFFTLNRRMV
jgi:hypothetical protein